MRAMHSAGAAAVIIIPNHGTPPDLLWPLGGVERDGSTTTSEEEAPGTRAEGAAAATGEPEPGPAAEIAAGEMPVLLAFMAGNKNLWNGSEAGWAWPTAAPAADERNTLHCSGRMSMAPWHAPATAAARATWRDTKAVEAMLLEHGAREPRTALGRTRLHEAARRGCSLGVLNALLAQEPAAARDEPTL